MDEQRHGLVVNCDDPILKASLEAAAFLLANKLQLV